MAKYGWFPDDYVSSTYDIDFHRLYEEGYRGLIFDVDNTLVPHNAPADQQAKDLFSYLNHLGYFFMFVSNNKEPRVRDFCRDVGGFGYVYLAGKPSPKGYVEAMERMGTNRENTLFIGDQILTDIWGANRAGVRNIMVRPVKKWHEEIQIILKRLLEAVILGAYGLYKKAGGAVRKAPLKEEGASLK